ncbi:MAG: hypothetical protein EP332_06870 [Bacteroidetes bacterium]|nr:MAG: hypothetical protein EP332_06870 [Bacteroidota bacterium]
MKTYKILIVLFFSLFQLTKAQTINWKSLESSRHILNTAIGWDYGLTYNVGYGFQLKTKAPIVLNAQFSIPSGEKTFDDFNSKIGVTLLLLNSPNLKGSITANGIYRKYDSPFVCMQNFGSELKGAIGYYKSKWFIAGEIGFDKAIVTHFKHSSIFRESVYSDVKDGWYEPATGGNFSYGLQTGYSFKKSDITLNIGKVLSQDFKTSPLIPFYTKIGFNYRIN